MSWSQSTSGSATQIVESIAKWKELVAKNDDASNASQAVKDGHAAQVDRVVATVTRFVNEAPEKSFSITGGGHAGQASPDGPLTSDSIWISLGQNLPAQ